MRDVLIVRTSALGDIVHGMPVAAALKARYPACRLTWLVEERYRGLIEGLACVDRCVSVRFQSGYPAGSAAERAKRHVALVRWLRRARFDASIDVQGLVRSGVLGLLSRATIRIGFPREHLREPVSALFSNVRPSDVPARAHVIDRNLALLRPLGIRSRCRDVPLAASRRAKERLARYFCDVEGEDRLPRVALQPAAGWSSKQWAPQGYARIGDRLVEEAGARVFVLWGPGERSIAEAVKGRMRRPARLVPDMGVESLMAFVGACDLLVGGDSGPLHLACALGVPVVGLYGPSDPVRNGPFRGVYRVVAARVGCGPCYRRSCSEPVCMASIDPDAVWDAVRGVLDECTRTAPNDVETKKEDHDGPGR